MKKTPLVSFLAAVTLSSAATAATVINPSFEDMIDPGAGGGSYPFFTWVPFAGSANASATNDLTSANSGTQSARISILGDDLSYAGIFQDFAVSEGDEVSVTGWHTNQGVSPLGVAGEIRIEWRDAGGGEFARVGNNGIVPGATYEMFSVSGTAPAGAVAARFVYAVQTFGSEQDGGATNSGFINVDDISVTIPEPSAATLFGLGLVGLLLRRKR